MSFWSINVNLIVGDVKYFQHDLVSNFYIYNALRSFIYNKLPLKILYYWMCIHVGPKNVNANVIMEKYFYINIKPVSQNRAMSLCTRKVEPSVIYCMIHRITLYAELYIESVYCYTLLNRYPIYGLLIIYLKNAYTILIIFSFHKP